MDDSMWHQFSRPRKTIFIRLFFECATPFEKLEDGSILVQVYERRVTRTQAENLLMFTQDLPQAEMEAAKLNSDKELTTIW